MRAILSAAMALSVAFAALGTSAWSQDAGGDLTIELNAAETIETGCRLTFVVENGLGHDIASAVFETVLFTRDGIVDRLTLFDMQALPADRPRVRQFDVPGLACDALGRVLINGVSACTGDGIDQSACEAGLVPSSRLEDVEMIG
ncbi:MAG: hypothetical protein AAF914_06900 [Pseudomonadota bacterium]